METQKIEALWTHLHWLTVLAQQGSYTTAAQRLGVSKAAMSQRIADLERAANVQLVQRTTRSVRLTEAGQRLVDDMRAPFEQIAHTTRFISQFIGTDPAGLLMNGVPCMGFDHSAEFEIAGHSSQLHIGKPFPNRTSLF